MHQQVHAFSISNQILTEPRVARNQDGSSSAIDPVAVSGLDLRAVIHLKSCHTNTIPLVHYAI